MMLSPHFSLAELTKSSTASRLNINNTPDDVSIEALKLVAVNILEPVRERYGAFTPSSGFRCQKLNSAIGSNANSQHTRGEAVDFELVGVDNYNLACWCQDNLKFDQLILECYDGSPYSGWVHISYIENKNRSQVLTISSKGIFEGLNR
jgi:zinc D-Ala-D-Ala carboxypeptidase|tara:strand:+ start:495 stop:941 length:447 start_codon:yes stop_codon:yes gene_type:complete